MVAQKRFRGFNRRHDFIQIRRAQSSPNIPKPYAAIPPDGRLSVRAAVVVRVGGKPLQLTSRPVALRRLIGKKPTLGKNALEAQRRLLDRLGSSRLADRVAARVKMQNVPVPAFHLLERAMDDADPEIAMAAARLRWWYQGTITYLGISYTPNHRERGIQITAMLKGSPADQAGLKLNDTLLRVGKTDLSMLTMAWKNSAANRLTRQIHANIRNLKPGTKIAITVKRGKETFKVEAVLGRIKKGEFGFN